MADLARELARIVGRKRVLSSPADLVLYSFESSIHRGRPRAVVLPDTTEEVVRIVRLAGRMGIPFIARGAGTNLSGGTAPTDGELVISLTRMNRILAIDPANQKAVVQPGVVNLDLQNALAAYGYTFCPDPASQKVSTLGGNVAENAGGPRCLKYGVTTDHVLALELVLPEGELVWVGGEVEDSPGYDLTGLVVGSEGTLGIVTTIVVRIVPLPEAGKTILAAFDSLEAAGEAVSEIISAGIVPAALEIVDKLTVQAIEASYNCGYPQDAAAVLIIDLDGLRESLDPQATACADFCRSCGATEVRIALSESERETLWAGRRSAFGASARLSPSFLVSDGTVPRTRLPEVLRKVGEIGERHRVRIGNVFHAGDGNLHPNIFFSPDDPDERRRAIEASHEILEVCAAVGGTISGEHGIGLEKISALSLIFSEADLAAMRRVKEVFDPSGLANPGKVLPLP
jgi:glycolate oxidase